MHVELPILAGMNINRSLLVGASILLAVPAVTA